MLRTFSTRTLAPVFVSALLAHVLTTRAADTAAPGTNAPVSFYRQVRPILQAQCHGCHQPAKAKGDYVMTDVARILKAGESRENPVVAGKPAESHLVKLITPEKGEAEMPKGKPPLHATEIDLITRWISEGATDDTPAAAKNLYDTDHPPSYTAPPIITSLDFSPDGRWIAAGGFHEVLIHRADGSGLEARLIGLSERIQTVRFSPDGKHLAVAGGQPARMGEIQVWDLEKKRLLVSVPMGYDTAYGVSWSPDGKLIAFGLPDKTIRAIDAATGRQVLQQGSHNDWVLDTVFSLDGAHIVSVGRDMTAKLTEVATQRFVDNITSITPGALRGGLQAIARHPRKNEILVGGSDGSPQIYQMFRTAARKIGDNAALLRRFPEMTGRIFSVDYSPDGDRIVAVANLDARGALNLYAARFDATIPTNILKAYEKTAGEYTREERDAIEKFVTGDIRLLHAIAFTNTTLYTARFSPDGKTVAAAGGDGQVKLIDPASGSIIREFAVAPRIDAAAAAPAPAVEIAPAGARLIETARESLPKGAEIASLEAQPQVIRLTRAGEHVQLLVQARLASGDTADVTRIATYKVSDNLGEVSLFGRFTPRNAGVGSLTIAAAGREVTVPIELAEYKPSFGTDFIRDINPILSKAGCNAGTCHGAKDGKNGFKLSLRGYDPIFDVRSFTDDLAARRINLASPDDSLLLLKATGAVPHEGGQRIAPGSEAYAILRRWIADGGRLDLDSARVARIEIFPRDPVVQDIGARQQMRVLATYADHAVRDVTAEAFIETGNADVATTDAAGLVTTLRRGEAPILARYEGNYAATTITVMGDRTGFTWKEPPVHNRIDELVAAKWKRMKILPSELCTDAEFVRRVSLDLTGLPPGADEVRRFLDDRTDSRKKREALIDRLIGSPEYADHWANKWADLLQVNRKFLGEEGARLFRDWIHRQVEFNVAYDDFVRAILVASGSNREQPAAAYFKILRQAPELMENTTHLFLGTRFNCNKCHDHPFERWTQDQYYHLAAFFAQVELKKDDASGDRRIGGTAVEGSKPLFEIVEDRTEGEIRHDRTGKVTAPAFPYPATVRTSSTKESRRNQLASWVTATDNRYFALSYVNRLWGYLMGVGLIEPLDDIRAGNPPSNPELLEHLTRTFIESGFNTRHLLREICQSRTYQLSLATHTWNADDRINYSHATARRLPAEVLIDAVYKVTGSAPNFPGVKPGTRAAQLPDSGVDLPSGFLATLGRPPRESACECERNNDIRLGSVMTLLSGPAVSGAVNDPRNDIARIVRDEPDDRRMINQVFLRVLNRPASDAEVEATVKTMSELEREHHRLIRQLGKAEAEWALALQKKEAARKAAIDKAEQDLKAYLVENAPRASAAIRERTDRIAAAEQAIQEFEPQIASRVDDWEQSLSPAHLGTLWTPLDPRDVAGTGSARLERAGDRTIRSSGTTGELPDYTVTADLTLPNITGLKLEVLTDDRAPKFGPGFKDGNFLLSEVIVQWASKTNAGKFEKLKITAAQADFVEKGLDLKQVYDGRSEQGRKEGWGVGGSEGRPHWLALALEAPPGDLAGGQLRVILQHRYQAPFEIARFRLWVTGSTNATHEGLPVEIARALENAAVVRPEDHAARIQRYYRSIDDDLRRLEQSLAAARKPLAADMRLAELQTALERAALPIATDAALVQLRQDVTWSTRQLANRRLTAAQDLSWALINTPSFLFNR